jgi:Family of unknown function (DUF5706)
MTVGAGGPLDKEKSEALEKLLLGSLQRTIDFLKYAEAKNGALLTLSSAWVLAILNLMFRGGIPSGDLYEYIVLPFLMLSAFAALCSFMPRVHLPKFLGGHRAGPHRKNLLYFGDVKSMTVSEFKAALYEHYCPADDRTVTDAYLHDLIVQVAINSEITSFKLLLFRVGLYFVGLAGLAFVCVTIKTAIW